MNTCNIVQPSNSCCTCSELDTNDYYPSHASSVSLNPLPCCHYYSRMWRKIGMNLRIGCNCCYLIYIKEQERCLIWLFVFFSTARTASQNTISRFSFFIAEHSMNCCALILFRIFLPSAVVMNFSEFGMRRSLFVPIRQKYNEIVRNV